MSLDSAEGVLPNPVAEKLQRYPDKGYAELKGAFAEYLNVSPSQLAVGPGVEGVILFTLLAFRGSRVLLPSPAFYLYYTALNALGCDYAAVDFGPEYKVTAEKLLENQSPGLIILTSPNNPTGTTIERGEIIRILGSVDCPVILDEVYAEVSGITNIDLLKKYENLIVFRSMSKSFSLAGARVGFAIGSEKLIRQIEQARLATIPYPISRLSAESAISALTDRAFIQQMRAETEKRRSIIQKFNQLDGIKAYPTVTNFFLLEAAKEKEPIVRSYCTDCRKFGLRPNFFRISLSDAKSLNSLLEALR